MELKKEWALSRPMGWSVWYYRHHHILVRSSHCCTLIPEFPSRSIARQFSVHWCGATIQTLVTGWYRIFRTTFRSKKERKFIHRAFHYFQQGLKSEKSQKQE